MNHFSEIFMELFFNRIPFLFWAIIIFLIMSCSAHTNLEPVGEGKLETSVGLGGPFIPIAETKIPTPYIAIGANFGIKENINIDGNLHITPLFYQLAGFDFGTTWFPILNKELIPTWGIQPRLLMLASIKSDVESRLRIYPLLSTSSAWQLGLGLIYVGSDFVFPFTKPDYNDETVNVIVSPFTGYRWNLGKNLRLLTELKWHGANVQSDQLAVEYINIGGYGAFSFMLSLEKRF